MTKQTAKTGKPKRAYSRAFTPRTARRVQLLIDRVPPTLMKAIRAKARRDGVALRSLVLDWLQRWAAGLPPDAADQAERLARARQFVRRVHDAIGFAGDGVSDDAVDTLVASDEAVELLVAKIAAAQAAARLRSDRPAADDDEGEATES